MNKNRYHILWGILLIIPLLWSCEKSVDVYSYRPNLVNPDEILRDDCDYIVVIGDVQVYTSNLEYYPYFTATMDWIWSQCKHGKNIKSVLQTGDITENNLSEQYAVFSTLTQPTAKIIPYISCVGNHDYTCTSKGYIDNRYSTLYSSYTNFKTTTTNTIDYFEKGRTENIVVKIEINGTRFDIISLEFGPRHEVIEWATNHIRSHIDRTYILLTHEYLTRNGEQILNNSYAEWQLHNTTFTTPYELWSNLIKDNNNILGLVCGHNGFSAHRFDLNAHGRDVPQILFNLQYQANGGDGWIQLWEFPKNSNYVNVGTYNTITRQFHPDENHSFQFKYKY